MTDKKLAGAALGKFSADIQDRLIGFIRRGYNRAEAARRCKIAPRTFGYWMARGRANLIAVAEAEEASPGEGDKVFDEWGLFRIEVEAAAQEYLGSLQAVINRKAVSDSPDAWKAAAWLLERRSPEFSKRQMRRSEADDPDEEETPSSPSGVSETIATGLTHTAAQELEDKFLGIRSRTP